MLYIKTETHICNQSLQWRQTVFCMRYNMCPKKTDTLNVMPLMSQVQETGCLGQAKRST